MVEKIAIKICKYVFLLFCCTLEMVIPNYLCSAATSVAASWVLNRYWSFPSSLLCFSGHVSTTCHFNAGILGPLY